MADDHNDVASIVVFNFVINKFSNNSDFSVTDLRPSFAFSRIDLFSIFDSIKLC